MNFDLQGIKHKIKSVIKSFKNLKFKVTFISFRFADFMAKLCFSVNAINSKRRKPMCQKLENMTQRF